jgi:CubicO group peptidase (beta-lactamase class C family)
MRRGVVLAIVFASLPTALAADGLDDFIGAELARRRIPGLALAVLRQGQPLVLRAYGLASVELRATDAEARKTTERRLNARRATTPSP